MELEAIAGVGFASSASPGFALDAVLDGEDHCGSESARSTLVWGEEAAEVWGEEAAESVL